MSAIGDAVGPVEPLFVVSGTAVGVVLAVAPARFKIYLSHPDSGLAA